jgi:hypothetical protein
MMSAGYHLHVWNAFLIAINNLVAITAAMRVSAADDNGKLATLAEGSKDA